MRKLGAVWFVLYLVLGLYFINVPFSFIAIPEGIAGFEQWIFLIGGVFLLAGAVNYIKVGKIAKIAEVAK